MQRGKRDATSRAMISTALLRQKEKARVKAVLGPTNTGKTHLAIERLCAHSSGAIGFPLRLLAREVYDRVCAIKGPDNVALITGEERIEPKNARWLLCTAEAMPVGADLAFVALDEAQLAADPERGHVFTDRLLHARGREETMLLGSSTIEPLIRSLEPDAEIVTRPRFSTLSHVGAAKLSRIPPRSAIVAFSAEQVYATAEMLRRFRGGAAVVMGALSPQTRNAQVEMYQSGEVDYLVATDAIGMGLNLDIGHVAFAGLSKYDGKRQRRLTISEMAQIAGRAGRHQRDGTFGVLSGGSSREVEFTPEEIFAIEEHRFPPLTRLFWREAEPRFDSLDTLINDLEAPPPRSELAPAPLAIDLAVLKRLADEPDVIGTVRGKGAVARFWEVCRLPDFRQHGAETHSRFVARLWQDLRQGYLGADYVASSIAQLDNPSGDIDTLQGRISAIRSWAYIAQRPDWVLAKEEMAARARAVEARLSDALHARLTERFVNRRTTVLMRKLGADASLLPVKMAENGQVLVDDEPIGHLEGFRFVVDPLARHADRKLLLAAAERHLTELFADRARALIAAANGDDPALVLHGGTIRWDGAKVADLKKGRELLAPRVVADHALTILPSQLLEPVLDALRQWLARKAQRPLESLRKIAAASVDTAAGSELRALLLHLVEAGGTLPRDSSGLERLSPMQREAMKKLGIRIGALDLFVPPMLKPAAMGLWLEYARAWGLSPAIPPVSMPVVTTATTPLPGYRRLGAQLVRVDMTEKLVHAAHKIRQTVKGRFPLDPSLALSMGLTTASYARLLRDAGFRVLPPRALAKDAFGPPTPPLWLWRPKRPDRQAAPAPTPTRNPVHGAFAALAELVR